MKHTIEEPIVPMQEMAENVDQMSGWRVKAGIIVAGLALSMSGGATEATAEASPDGSAAVSAERVSPQNSKKDTKVTVGTYNIKGSNKTGPGINDRNRAKIATDLVKGKYSQWTPRLDLFGVQEMQKDQKRYFKQMLPGYGVYSGGGRVNNSIFFDKNRFKRENAGAVRYPYYGDHHGRQRGRAPWMRLVDRETDQSLFIINAHAVAFNGNDGAMDRLRTARNIAKWVDVKDKKFPDIPKIVTGDLNSTNVLRTQPDKYTPRIKDASLRGDRRKLPYCVLTEDPDQMRSTYDMDRKTPGACPTDRQAEHLRYIVDWIFASNDGVTVSDWGYVRNEVSNRASDHELLSAKLVIKNR